MPYNMAARIAHLVLSRRLAVAKLVEGTITRSVGEAIDLLTADPEPGTPGGPARTADDAAAIYGRPPSTVEGVAARVERGRKLGKRRKRRP